MKNADVLSDQEQDLPKIEETDRVRELFMAFSVNVPKSANGKKVIDRNEFKGGWGNV